MKTHYYLNHSQIDALFKPTHNDFVVKELPLYPFSGEGEHIAITLRKKNLATWDALTQLSQYIGCGIKEIGYAGLKDKHALTVQHITVPRKYEQQLEHFEHPHIKLLNKTYHNNKLRIGHLKGNHFFIRLKHVTPVNAKKLEEVLSHIAQQGIPNYFGFQRFGIDGKNYEKGQQIIQGTLKEKRNHLKQMYVNAYQSYLFNEWLSKRVTISQLIHHFTPEEIHKKLDMSLTLVKELKQQPHIFKILPGEMMSHYPFGKIFSIQEIEEEAQKFYERDRVPTGLLAGKRVKRSENTASLYESLFDERGILENGSRRFAWVFPEDIQSEYKLEKYYFELQFKLPKGSYATQLISELTHQY